MTSTPPPAPPEPPDPPDSPDSLFESAEHVRRSRTAYAWAAGAVCHVAFAAAVVAMIGEMAFGMSRAFGRVPPPWSLLANGLLILQFVAPHSLLLSRRGAGVLSRFAPKGLGGTMATTTYATVVSLQTLALFTLWTPSNVVWWRASGALFWLILLADAAAWLLLLKAIWDAGFALQTGALGWRAAVRGRTPAYPPMPTTGLFRHIRQPIYLAFALSTWAVPVWTPDQLVIALSLTGYCLLGPLLKERRFARRHGQAFDRYRAATPYWLPRPRIRL